MDIITHRKAVYAILATGMWGRSRFSCSGFRGDLGIITFFNLQTSCIFLLKTIKKTTPALDVVFQTTGLERKKTPCKKVSFCRRIRFWI